MLFGVLDGGAVYRTVHEHCSGSQGKWMRFRCGWATQPLRCSVSHIPMTNLTHVGSRCIVGCRYCEHGFRTGMVSISSQDTRYEARDWASRCCESLPRSSIIRNLMMLVRYPAIVKKLWWSWYAATILLLRLLRLFCPFITSFLDFLFFIFYFFAPFSVRTCDCGVLLDCQVLFENICHVVADRAEEEDRYD